MNNDFVVVTLIIVCAVAGLDIFLRTVVPRVRRAIGRRRNIAVETEAKVPTWLQAIDHTIEDADLETRMSLIDALHIVNDRWSREILQLAYSEETEPVIRAKIYEILHEQVGTDPTGPTGSTDPNEPSDPPHSSGSFLPK